MKRMRQMGYTGLSTKQIVAVSVISVIAIAVVYRIDKLKDIVTDSNGSFFGFNF